MVTTPRAEYEQLKAQNEWLLEQLRATRNKKFGSSSEKATEDIYEQLSLLFDEVEVYVSETEDTSPVEVWPHTRRQKSGHVRDILPEDIEVVEVEHTLPEDEHQCPQCGDVMQAIGTEIRETLKLVPAKAILQRDIYYSYACDNCKRNDIFTPVEQTPKELALIPG